MQSHKIHADLTHLKLNLVCREKLPKIKSFDIAF